MIYSERYNELFTRRVNKMGCVTLVLVALMLVIPATHSLVAVVVEFCQRSIFYGPGAHHSAVPPEVAQEQIYAGYGFVLGLFYLCVWILLIQVSLKIAPIEEK
ncbi:MAG TPA: hypothetical protein VF803_01790 [Candidatus Paceibacterota bacterium]